MVNLATSAKVNNEIREARARVRSEEYRDLGLYFPRDMAPTPCEYRTNIVLVHTKHGIVRKYVRSLV